MSNLLAKLFSGLTQQGVTLPNGQFQNAAQAEDNIPQLPDAVRSAGGLNATEAPSTVSQMPFLQASHQGPGGTPNAMAPQLSTKGKILTTLLSAAAGGAAAAGQRTVGGGFQAGMELPYQQAQMRQNAQKGQLENQVLQEQVQYAPLLRQLGIMKSQSEINKSNAEAGKATAEAGAVPFKTALEKAQTEAANYKDDPNMGLIDLRTGKPVYDASAPLTADEAQVLGKQAGERVPLKLKNTANEISNRGIRTAQGGGRSLLIDNQGNTIKDLGAATPLVTMQAQLGSAGNPNSPEFQSVVDAVGQGKMDLQTAVGRMGRFPGASFALMSAVEQKYPSYFQGNYEAAKKVLDSFTSGNYSQNLNAIDTARKHMGTFRELAEKLNNGDTRAFNALGNAIGTQFGSDKVTNFNIAKQFFSGEVGKAVVAGGGTAGERDQLAESINNASSWQQLSGALTTADELLSGKQAALKNTFNSGMQSQPNFGGQAQEIHYKIVNGQLVAQ